MRNSNDSKLPRWGVIAFGSLIVVLVTAISMLKDRFFANESLFFALIGGIMLFAIYEVISIVVVNKSVSSVNPRRLVNIYLATKVGRVLLALLYAGIYVLFVKQEVKHFILVFVLIYFVYLIFDTLLLTSWEKNLKKK